MIPEKDSTNENLQEQQIVNPIPQPSKPDVSFVIQMGIGCGGTIGLVIVFIVLYSTAMGFTQAYDIVAGVIVAAFLVSIIVMNYIVYHKNKWSGFVAGSLGFIGIAILLFGLCVAMMSSNSFR